MPSGSGKTVAAEFLMFGDHIWRPERAILIQCTGMTDFAGAQFTESFGTQQEAVQTMATLLVEALLPAKDKVTVVLDLMQNILNFMQKLKDMHCVNPSYLKTWAAEDEWIKRWLARRSLIEQKIMSIYHFSKDANITFVDKLYSAAHDKGVKVFIFMKNNEWAANMIKINRGEKIVPLEENVDNSWDGIETFVEAPKWNCLNWTNESLVEVGRLRKYQVDNSIDFGNGT
eukprot:scaffold17426_cov58-Attheya_sp.AAC.2